VQQFLDQANQAAKAGQLEAALKACDQALATARAGSDQVGEARAHRGRALFLTRLHREAEAAQAWNEASAAWKRAGDGPGQVEALAAAALLLIQEQPAAAGQLLEQALAVVRAESRRPLAAAGAVSSAGTGFYLRDRLREAELLERAALGLQEKLAPGSLAMADTLHHLGAVARAQRNLLVARDYHRRALTIRKKLAPGSLDVAKSLSSLGYVSEDEGNLVAARGLYQQALAIREKLAPDSLVVAASLDSLGSVSRDQGDLAAAHRFYQRALTIREKLLPGSMDLASNLNDLGRVAHDRGDLVAARELHRRALALEEKLAPGSLELAALLVDLGFVARDQGDLAAARDYHQQALAIQEKLAPESLDVAASLEGLGVVANDQGDLAAARDYHQQALNIRRKLEPDSLDVAASLNNLGNVADDQGDLVAAREFLQQALAIKEKLAPASLNVALSLDNLGVIARNQGDRAAAQEFHQRALEIRKKLAPDSLDLARSLNNLAIIAHDQGNTTAARDFLERALAIKEKLAPASLDLASSLGNVGFIAQERGDLKSALELDSRAWQIVRARGVSVTGDEARQAFGSRYALYAAQLVGCQLALGQRDAAFVTLEEGRAQALQQLLAERHIDERLVDRGIWVNYKAAEGAFNHAGQLLAQAGVEEGKAEKELRTLEARVPTVRGPPLGPVAAAGDRQPRARLTAAREHRAAAFTACTQARLRMEQCWGEVKRSAPAVFPEPLSLEQARRALPPDALFLSFTVGEQGTRLFLVSPAGDVPVRAYSLPFTELQLTEQVAKLRHLMGVGGDARGMEVVARQVGQDPFTAASRALFEQLFPAEARQSITRAGRLLLSPDGPLWELPFAALVTNQEGVPRYLGLEKPLAYTPALFLFARARQQRPVAQESVGRGDSPVALVVGNPLFAPPGVSAPTGAATTDRTGERRAFFDGQTPPPLPYAEQEARQIAALYHTEPLLGAAATEAAVRQRLPGAAIVHLATHGYYHPYQAMASGILLAAPSAATAAPEEDGVLQAWEIFSQVKLKAELVVLSACESGRGEKRRGEGLVGLTRALEYAGAHSVVVSQWSVSDPSTAALMVALHQKLRAGIAKDEALRQAMASVQAEAKTAHPAFWAAFFLVGNPENSLLAR
jgi:CHAT domain-containing protein/tetratricopeptide (TPR) repeat protein